MALGKRTVVSGSKTVAAKDKHQVITIKGKSFAKDLNRFNEVKEEISNLTTEKASIEGIIKAEITEAYLNAYKSAKRNPGTIKIESENGDRIMFIPTKKYVGAVDEDRATELRQKYGNDFVEEKTELVMNNDLLSKYSKELEKLIMSAKFMTDAEKEELFVERVTYSITEDAIENGFTTAKGDVEGLFSDINPVCNLKATK